MEEGQGPDGDQRPERNSQAAKRIAPTGERGISQARYANTTEKQEQNTRARSRADATGIDAWPE